MPLLTKKNFWIYLLSGAVYFTQGIEGLPGMSLFFYLKETLHFDASTIMYIGSIAGIAWLVKPIWGYLCDNFLTKKLWTILSLLGSIIIASYFGLSNLLTLPLLIGLIALANWNAAVRDVANDGIMCVEGKEANACDKIQALQWTAITIASIIVGLAGGYIADHFSYKVGYLCLIPIYLIIIGIVSRYKSSNTIRETQISQKPLATLISYKALFTDKRFLIACIFLFLYKYSPSFGTPLSFIERDVFKWSGQYMGTLGAIISCFEIVGSIIFFKICKKINVQRWLYISVFLGAITSLCYLYFTPITAIAYGISFAVLGMFIHLIVMSFMANSTIPGKEATSFALLCSINNLAATASSLSGAFLYPKIGLQWLIILSTLTSFVCLPLIKQLNFNNYTRE
jgi:predicted MFS family arabinose efflux permease